MTYFSAYVATNYNKTTTLYTFESFRPFLVLTNGTCIGPVSCAVYYLPFGCSTALRINALFILFSLYFGFHPTNGRSRHVVCS